MDALADVLPFGKMLHTAPLGIVVCVDMELEKHRGFWVQDCSNATMNLLLAAHDQGLGAVWAGVYPVRDRVTGLKQVLGLPKQVVPLSVVPLGYAAAKPEPPVRRYNRASRMRQISISLVSMLVVMISLEWRLTLVGVTILPLLILPSRRVGSVLRQITRQQRRLRAEMSALMNETLNVSGALLIKIFGRRDDEVRRFADKAV